MKMAAMAAQLVPSPPSLGPQGARGSFSGRWVLDQVYTCSPQRVFTENSGTELPSQQGGWFGLSRTTRHESPSQVAREPWGQALSLSPALS